MHRREAHGEDGSVDDGGRFDFEEERLLLLLLRRRFGFRSAHDALLRQQTADADAQRLCSSFKLDPRDYDVPVLFGLQRRLCA